MTKQWSHYQQAIFDWVKKDKAGHGQGRALAGSGKTTTEVESLKFMRGNVLAVAFNKSIADELGRRVASLPNVTASTTHSFGLRCLGQGKRVKVDQFKVGRLLEAEFDLEDKKQKSEYYKLRNPVTRMVSLLKSEGQYTKPSMGDIQELADFHGIDLPGCSTELAVEMLECSKRQHSVVDFDDMIFMPVYLGLQPKKFDWVAVDEYQDMNRSQNDLLNLATGEADPFELSAGDGRMLVVGDAHQAIYGFRGAMAGIMDGFLMDKKATLLPLNICYRCSRAIIREAQRIVPEIEACDGAPEGKVGEISRPTFEKDVSVGDFALCRKVAPLVKTCLRMIRLGRPALVRGRKIGEDLFDMLNGLPAGDSLGDRLDAYRNRETQRIERSTKFGLEEKLEALNDRVDTLLVILEGLSDNGTIPEIKTKLQELFSDEVDRESIIFSSIHKAKGLESDRVYILPSTPCKVVNEWQEEQERNLRYVAITRARKELFYVAD